VSVSSGPGRLDLLRGTVRVAEAPEVAGRLEWGGVKTHEARTVRLPRFLRDELAAYLADRPHGPEDLVFTAPLGGPLRESKWIPGYFKPAGLPGTLRFYDLRHTAASLLIRARLEDIHARALSDVWPRWPRRGRPPRRRRSVAWGGGAGGGARTLMPLRAQRF
jgi:integrase